MGTELLCLVRGQRTTVTILAMNVKALHVEGIMAAAVIPSLPPTSLLPANTQA